MLKKQGIVIILFLFTRSLFTRLFLIIVFLFTVDNLLINNILAFGFTSESFSLQIAQSVAQPSRLSVPPSQLIAEPSQPVAEPSQSVTQPSQSVTQPSQSVTQPSQSVPPSESILSTSYKRYSLCRYDDNYILCEPYTVQRGDWVYKIFRSKGELSKIDFAMFIQIFKSINPNIKNMNNIKIGQQIIIPLRKSKQNDFKETKPGIVDLPIITLTQIPDKASKSIKSKPQESVDDSITNSAIGSIATTTPIPKTFSNEKINVPPQDARPQDLRPQISIHNQIPVRQLKQFAMINNAQLIMNGKYYFPRDNGDDLVIDVAFNPMMHFKNGSRILFVPEKNTFDKFADTIKNFWQDLKIMEFGEVNDSLGNDSLGNDSLQGEPVYLGYNPPLSSIGQTHIKQTSDIKQPSNIEQRLNTIKHSDIKSQENAYVPINITIGQDHKLAIKQLLEITGYKYTPEKEITISVGNIKVKATPGLITRNDNSDILVVFGDIYGSAFEALKKMKQGDIVTISPLLTTMNVAKKLFSALGATSTDNPAFVNPIDGKTISISGMYIKDAQKEIFITEKPTLLKEAFRYLTEKNITILLVDRPL